MSARIVDGLIVFDSAHEEITAEKIAEGLHRAGGNLILPTQEQRQIIESRHFGPAVIIAGVNIITIQSCPILAAIT